MIRFCLYCKNKLTGKQRKYCSIKCYRKNNYFLNKDKYIANSFEWQKNNPERTREIKKKALAKFMKEKPERFKELIYKANKKYRNTEKGKISYKACCKRFREKKRLNK